MPPDFRAEIVHQDGTVVIALLGELDRLAATESADLKALRELSSRYDPDQVTLDLSRLAFIDAAGLAAVARVVRAFGPDGRLRVVNPRAIVRRLIEITQMTHLFEIVDHFDGIH